MPDRVKDKPNKVTTTLKVVVTGEFYDDEASEETLRYCVEQDLEDAGYNVDVTRVNQNRIDIEQTLDETYGVTGGLCPTCGNWIQSAHSFCGFCGQPIGWKKRLLEQEYAKIKEPDCRICGQSSCSYYHESWKPTDCKSYVRID